MLWGTPLDNSGQKIDFMRRGRRLIRLGTMRPARRNDQHGRAKSPLAAIKFPVKLEVLRSAQIAQCLDHPSR
jgi:hypothetical protein